MAERFSLVCLANARRMGGRCVAGTDNEGEWIRPVHPLTGGELSTDQIRLEGGRDPRLLDVISVPLLEPRPRPEQPENWAIADGPWRHEGHLDRADAEPLLDGLLWRSRGLFGDSLPYREYSVLKANPIDASLLLIEPENLSWEVQDREDGKHFRALFVHEDESYDLPVTDPVIEDLLRQQPIGGCAFDIGGHLEADRAFLTISLAGPWPRTQRCYKLVAAVISLV
ncbi:MAG: dual OB domain-containing protein [Acidimicrobiales bacterium]|jgi:hypothetical protein